MFIKVTEIDNSRRLINLDCVEDIIDASEESKKRGAECLILYRHPVGYTLDVKDSFEDVMRAMQASGQLAADRGAKETPTANEEEPKIPIPTSSSSKEMHLKTCAIRATVYVESGTLLLGDERALKELGLWGGKDACDAVCADVHDIPPEDINEEGFTLLAVEVDCWLGKVSDTFRLHLPSGHVFLGDPCRYMAEDKWADLLKRTDHLQNLPAGVFRINVGGDGRFAAEFFAEKP